MNVRGQTWSRWLDDRSSEVRLRSSLNTWSGMKLHAYHNELMDGTLQVDCRLRRRPSPLEHSNSRFESILFDSLCESIRIDSFSKKSAFRFTSCHAVFFLFIYCIVSTKKNKLTSLFAAFNTLDVFNLLEIV